jgi:ribose transport system permease protein
MKDKAKKNISLILVYGIMVLLAVIANFISPGFLGGDNIMTMLRQIAFLGIACLGQTIVILTAGIDLSLCYTLVLCNIVSAYVIGGENANMPKAFLICMLISIAIGLVNGAGIHFLHIPAMIMTLASGSAIYGIAYIYCNGSPKGRTSPLLDSIANGKVGGVLNGTVIIWIVLSIVVIILLKYTNFGRSIYAIGINPVTANYSGISVPRVLMTVYVLSSVFAGFTGFLLLGYTGTAYLSTGASYNMDSIAAVVIGGTSVLGGEGGYVGTIAGVAIMTIITSLMTVMNMAESGKEMIQGLIIIVLLVAVYGRRSKNKF